MHITLTGNLGSGKSTICKILDTNYQYEIYSTGKVQRKLAQDLGISVLEMNQLMCTDHKYDKMIDDTTAKISKENPDKNIVFDSRLAWNFVSQSFKVFLSVSLDVAAHRVYQDNRGEVEKYASIQDAKEQLKLRAETEDVRYKDIYGLDYFNFANYDLVLDSTYASPELLAKVMLAQAQKAGERIVLMSPKRLGVADAVISETPSCYYPSETVTIQKEGDDFKVVSGMDVVKAAAQQGLPFVKAKMA